MSERCPLNVPGDFYTSGHCLACEAPEAEAPDLLAPLREGNDTTYFVRQPSTPEEIEQACNAIRVCCVADLRYGGTDITIIERLGNDPNHSDYILLDGKLTFVGKPADPLSQARQVCIVPQSRWARFIKWVRTRFS